MKTCTRCHNLKSLSEFYSDETNKTGVKNQCKRCFNRSNYEARLRRQNPTVIDDSILVDQNTKAIERALKAFKYTPLVEADLQKKMAPEPVKSGLKLYRSKDGSGRASFKTPKGLIEFKLSEKTALELAEYVSKWGIEVPWGQWRIE